MTTQTPATPATAPAHHRDEPAGEPQAPGDQDAPAPEPEAPAPPRFILYLQGAEYGQTLRRLTLWVHNVLLPVYGREVTSTAPWCSRWWEHHEAVAQLHALWLAWGELTGPDGGHTGPAAWHRDFLGPVMATLRDPQGPFAGCKPGGHRAKEAPPVDARDPFGPRPGVA
ncbi:DUF4913 domain-containing protein [Streptomyces sp. NPDC059378]|uniref:DUF4913 domain-containing protein n=1 Tax=Streptomyces sp. NPDC059378 TaxID=3346815 RepID=UPI0036C89CBD